MALSYPGVGPPCTTIRALVGQWGGSLSPSKSPLVKSPSEFFTESVVPHFHQIHLGQDTEHPANDVRGC